ncbi:MAG TPA: hypothetical protein V6D48_17680 [Oculatellaceae cyanobacterium]
MPKEPGNQAIAHLDKHNPICVSSTTYSANYLTTHQTPIHRQSARAKVILSNLASDRSRVDCTQRSTCHHDRCPKAAGTLSAR